jgi:broad specificity phosphatase PhoE
MTVWIALWIVRKRLCGRASMVQIILARAGSTDYDDQERVVGNLDIPVNVRGQAEMAELASELRRYKVGAVYSTAAESARQSAKFLGEQLDLKVRVLEDLRNQDFGLWQGLKVDELRRKHRKVYKQWEESPCAVCPPAGEMIEQVFQRVRKGLKPVLKRRHNDVAVLIAPDPLRQVIRCYLKHRDLSDIWADDNGSTWEVIDVP